MLGDRLKGQRGFEPTRGQPLYERKAITEQKRFGGSEVRQKEKKTGGGSDRNASCLRRRGEGKNIPDANRSTSEMEVIGFEKTWGPPIRQCVAKKQRGRKVTHKGRDIKGNINNPTVRPAV